VSFYVIRKKTPDVFSGSKFELLPGVPLRRMIGTGGVVFHVLNRGVRRLRLFDEAGDYGAFINCLAEARDRVPIRLFAYCLMPNHFHLVLRPELDGQLSEFMRLLTGTHSKRWHAYRGSAGTGAVYQGRYKAFPVQTDRHFLTVCRYVERNALRANLVGRAEDWRWSSLSRDCRNCNLQPLDSWPILPPPDWIEVVNRPQHPAEEADLRQSIRKNRPYGPADWRLEMASRLHLEQTIHPRGRPRRTSGVFFPIT
jgi:putative transposase